ncbi:hypothetical protein AN1V17_43390 [Vallitalea sediminicola]
MKNKFRIISFTLVLTLVLVITGCQKSAKQIVIYTNADEEAMEAMKTALNDSGFEDEYILQGMGTSELGGKLMAEGSSIEADLITMSSYFIESAQKEHKMFLDLTFDTDALLSYPAYYTPILANTGAIFVNTEVINDNKLPLPKSIKDLTLPEYKDLVSIPSIIDSSTAWLMIQAIINEYGEDEGLNITKDLVENCGAHIESSGSGPIKKVRVGEVGAGFGLRHQAVQDNVDGKPIKFIDPIEGNFSLTEAVAVVKKGNEKQEELAMKMAQVIIKEARTELLEYYPVALYEGESIDELNKPGNPKEFNAPLTVNLLKQHQEFYKQAQ